MRFFMRCYPFSSNHSMNVKASSLFLDLLVSPTMELSLRAFFLNLCYCYFYFYLKLLSKSNHLVSPFIYMFRRLESVKQILRIQVFHSTFRFWNLQNFMSEHLGYWAVETAHPLSYEQALFVLLSSIVLIQRFQMILPNSKDCCCIDWSLPLLGLFDSASYSTNWQSCLILVLNSLVKQVLSQIHWDSSS